MLKWTVGDVTITRIVELETSGGTRFLLPQATYDEVKAIPWLFPHFAEESGKLKMSIHALVVETPTRRLIVDTCIGNDRKRDVPQWSDLQTTFLDDLKAAGFDPAGIDTVLCTHLHVDHVGWNTMKVGGKWVPTFPNARYLLGKAEFAHWSAEGDDEQQQILSDSVQPVLDAGLAEFVDMDHVISPNLRLTPTTGHTPGHVSVMIESEGESAVITGDMTHHPCQLAHPDWSPAFDSDPNAAAVTRARL
ncbi:MAG TPA: MBL fold metallo-hydrolase, partial [Polyangia bacterium]|nr:MBL fold metallo-hydrolase [Polyangia bacterium]